MEYSLKKRPDGFVIELPVINSRTRLMEYCYVDRKNILNLYKKIIDQITDKRFGIKESAFIRRLSEVLQNNSWAGDTQNIVYALDSDDAFYLYLIDYIRNNYNDLFVIDDIFENNTEMLLYLIRLQNDKLSRYFNNQNIKYKLADMLGVTRLDVLRQMRTKNDMFTRIMSFLGKLIPFLRGKLHPRVELIKIINDQYRSYGKGTFKRHDLPKVTKPASTAVKNNNPPVSLKNNWMNILFKSRKTKLPDGNKADEKTIRNRYDSDLKIREKITSFKKALLEREGFSNEDEYLAYFLKKWSMKPKEDEKILKEILSRKDVNKNVSWQVSIRRDLAGMSNLDVYMDSVLDVAKAVASEANKKHININHLAAYIGFYVLNVIERGL